MKNKEQIKKFILNNRAKIKDTEGRLYFFNGNDSEKNILEKMKANFPKVKEDDYAIMGFCNSRNTSKLIGVLVTSKFIYTRPNRLFPSIKICIEDIELIFNNTIENKGMQICTKHDGKEDEYGIAGFYTKADTDDFRDQLTNFLDNLVKLLK